MRRSMWVAGIVGVALSTAACGRGSSGRGGAADSTAAVVVPVDTISAMPGDSTSPRQDSTATVAPVRTTTGGAAKVPAKAPAKPAPVSPAYDSAFGPSFTVDSTGKITPIRKKKP